MTLEQLNGLLEALAQEPARERVLDFSYALLQWMGLKPAAEKTPQLLAPKTQKLKEYLAPAPQTTQAQLYRLTEDGQSVRVRFAVLKKLKKDYISLLVDKDPGAESFQNTPAPLRAITKNPYLIHFITTPAYDRLMLVFSQGDQKRILTFRSRLTQTQYFRIVKSWQEVAFKPKPEIADLLWKSLDVKEVNKEFYRQIKERFDALIGIINQDKPEVSEGIAKQFAVRLIGRYIFCWFLKEKNIIPEALLSTEIIRDTKNAYRTVLQRLFIDTLNTKVQDRPQIALSQREEALFEKIPYLNGGLFDENEEDTLFKELNLDDWLSPFVKVLESYDFTVDESSSAYQQVAVDPEMLGRVFENLLASQNPETEKLASQRKAFGAFYTPREIVDYMVSQSLKAYLATKLNVSEEELEPAFAINPEWPEKLKSRKTEALQALQNIKILDPACGSGAFPMGTLHKLVELHELLGTVKTAYELKKDILSQNVFGVDIMPMAVEIARLRAWLSLALEEEYKANDPRHNFGIKPLPNLDFKFVCANSLIDPGYDTFADKFLRAGNAPVPSLQALNEDINILVRIQRDYYDAAENNRNKNELEMRFKSKQIEITEKYAKLKEAYGLEVFFKKIEEWYPFHFEKAAPFFSPAWMFGVSEGFDVVIANPPYVDIKKLPPQVVRELFLAFSTARRRINLYSIFLELGYRLLSKYGNLIYIVPNSLLVNESYRCIRKLLLENTELVIKLPDNVFEAIVDTIIIQVQFDSKKENVKVKSFRNDEDVNLLNLNYNLVEKSSWKGDPEQRFNLTSDSGKANILKKVEEKGTELSCIADISLGITPYDRYRGHDEETIKTRIFHSKTPLDETYVPLIRGKNILPFYVSDSPIDEYLKYGDWLGAPRERRFFTSPRIIIRQIVCGKPDFKIHAGYTEKELYFTQIAFGVIPKDSSSASAKYLTAILNSKLIRFYHAQKFLDLEKEVFQKILIANAKKLPILEKPDESKRQALIELVEKIIAANENKVDFSALEELIDFVVYTIYGLTYEEIRVIDPDVKLTAEEYQNFRIEEISIY